MESTLPKRLIELSKRSLRSSQPTPCALEEYFSTTEIIKLKPNPIETTVVAADVSSIKLGETETGILLAVRGAIVWRLSGRYRYLRLGPFPFHISDKNRNEICSFLQHPNTDEHIRESSAVNILHAQTRLMTLLERCIQSFINQTTSRGVILWDGSLTAGSQETPLHAMKWLLREARNRQNTVLAFSKMTQLFSNGHRITDLVWKNEPPCILKIEDSENLFAGPMISLGNVYVAKLTRGVCAFRLDIDKELPDAQAVEAVQKLLGNDWILQSYPETLRLAHIYSTFTANEVLGMQRCIIKEGDLKIVSRPNIRRILFGCFGKGPESS